MVTVDRPISLEFDSGSLAAFDTNPLDPERYRSADGHEECLVRDGAQVLWWKCGVFPPPHERAKISVT